MNQTGVRSGTWPVRAAVIRSCLSTHASTPQAHIGNAIAPLKLAGYSPAMWLLLLSLLTPAHALTTDRSGYGFDLAGGVDVAIPGSPSGQVQLGAHWWWGPYDDSSALGRYWALGPTDTLTVGEQLSLSPTLEVRRGLDLIVVGWYAGLGAGPVVPLTGQDPLGATARLIGGFEFRRSATFGFTARAELGADLVGDAVHGTASVLLGVQISRPADGKGIK